MEEILYFGHGEDEKCVKPSVQKLEEIKRKN
jgi:hypothetical protein